MTYTMKAEVRNESGKGIARRIRREGFVPGVIYGGKEEPMKIALDAHSLLMARQAGGFYTNVQDVEIDGKTVKVLPREIQKNPVSDKPIHVDFMRFDPNRKIKVMVRVAVIDEDQSAGVKKGGVISLVRNQIELLCKADAIPDVLEISIAGLDVGQAAKMSEITLPEGVEPVVSDRDFTVATILSTRTSTMSKLDGDEEGESEEGESEE